MRLVGDTERFTPMDYWEKKGIEKPQTKIVCAACIVFHNENEVLLVGARHFDAVMRNQATLMGIDLSKTPGKISGFIDQFGYFHEREEALAIVKAFGQPFNQERNGSSTKLFSEGLY